MDNDAASTTATEERDVPQPREASGLEVAHDDAVPEVQVDPVQPSEWLDPAEYAAAADIEPYGEYVVPTNGRRLRLGLITDEENDRITRLCLRPASPGNPNGPKRMDLQLYRRWLIATSLNKAAGRSIGQPGAVTAEDFAKRGFGEVTVLAERICAISGLRSERDDPNQVAAALFS